jgi:copper resistance protein C
MSTHRTITVLSASAALVLCGAVSALAHAHLVRATPAVGGTVHTPPSEVTLRFNEKLEAAFSSVVVRDATGKQVDKGDGTVDKSDRTLMRVPLQGPLTPGVYKVEWKAMSADTHKIDGNFTFKVGE